jgi:hypothetical protein
LAASHTKGNHLRFSISEVEKREQEVSPPELPRKAKRGKTVSADAITTTNAHTIQVNHSPSARPSPVTNSGSGCDIAGRVANYAECWSQLTNDNWLLHTIQGIHIEFDVTPVQKVVPKQFSLSDIENKAIEAEIQRLLAKGVITPSCHEQGEFLSTIFVKPKKNGTYRLILNLKELNKFVTYHHFKMDSVHTALHMMKKNCFMASIDLRDAYYSIPISQPHQKYLKFGWHGQLYQFTCLPNGLACAPQIFTKLLKPVYSTLRRRGHLIFGYIDDSYLQGDNYQDCARNVSDSSALFQKLGFILHDEKSVTEPTQQLVLLGYVLNSVNMTVSLTPEWSGKLRAACEHLYNEQRPSIHEVAHVVGMMVASFFSSALCSFVLSSP